MNDINKYEFTIDDCSKIMNFARDALYTYIIEGQRMDIGSVDDVLNKRAGVIIQIESANGFKRLRGSSGIYDGRRIADAIIDATIHAASSRSIGSEINASEIDNVIFKISVVEKVQITKEPEEILDVGENCPIITKDINHWLYPTQAIEQQWSPEEYIHRTVRTSSKDLSYDDIELVAVLDVKSFVEQNPNGKTILDTAK